MQSVSVIARSEIELSLSKWAEFAPRDAVYKMRTLCTAFNKVIGLNDIQSICKKVCAYDDSEYDPNYYNRMTARETLQDELLAYVALRIPAIIKVYDEFLDENTDSIGETVMPYEFRCFLYYYLANPNLNFVLMGSATLKRMLHAQYCKIRNEIGHGIKDRAYFVPLFYVKSINSRNDIFSGNIGSISVVCYVNLMIDNMSFPAADSRFMVITAPIIPADDHATISYIVDRIITEHTETSIIKMSELADNVRTFADCISLMRG
jgi:hypothetical protein